MAAKVDILKFTGKTPDFGTPVVDLALKGIDGVPPAVYQTIQNRREVTPASDISDCKLYPVFKPINCNEHRYSFETVFRIKLHTPPSNTLCNIRIYPDGNPPDDPDMAVVCIGASQRYSKPVESKSTIAINNIWQYTRENPFLVPIGGLTGYAPQPGTPTRQSFGISLADPMGEGCELFLDGMQTPSLRLGIGDAVQFIDRAGNTTLVLRDATTGTLIEPAELSTLQGDCNPNTPSTIGNFKWFMSGGIKVYELNVDATFMQKYPRGLTYTDMSITSSLTIDREGIIEWSGNGIASNLHWIGLTTAGGTRAFTIDGRRRPDLTLKTNEEYEFRNPYGNRLPFRIYSSETACERDIVFSGVRVENGGTRDEIVHITPSKLPKGNLWYMSPVGGVYGATLSVAASHMTPSYNMKSVGHGTDFPLNSGETDYIYLQANVSGKTQSGSIAPNLLIEWDEY